MTLHYRINNSKKAPTLQVADGDIFEECNFTQLVAGTQIFKTKKDLRFIRCNLANCVIPATAKVIQCQTAKYTFEDIDPQKPELGKTTVYAGSKEDPPKLTDKETETLLEPYKEIRQDRNTKPKWVKNG